MHKGRLRRLNVLVPAVISAAIAAALVFAYFSLRSPVSIHNLTGELHMKLITTQRGVAFPVHYAYAELGRLVLDIQSRDGRQRIAYEPIADMVTDSDWIFPEKDRLIPVGDNTLLEPEHKYRYQFKAGPFNIFQKIQEGCKDTPDNTLLIGLAEEPAIRASGLGNIYIYPLDLESDGREELYIINAYCCKGILELYRIDI